MFCCYFGHVSKDGEKSIRLPLKLREVKHIHLHGFKEGRRGEDDTYKFKKESMGMEMVKEGVFCEEHSGEAPTPQIVESRIMTHKHKK